MSTSQILIVEDDNIVARTVERCLRGGEFHVTVANTGVEGLQIAHRNPPDLVILDVIMPGMDGYAVCREMRGDPVLKEVPILFLTAKAKEEDRITGFLAGADDYLSKPFNVDELLLRVRAVLRRTLKVHGALNNAPDAPVLPISREPQEAALVRAEKKPNSISIREFSLNTKTFELSAPHLGKIRLTPIQYDLLYHLMTHAGEIFSPSRLLDEVWDYPSDAGSPDLVRVHIKNLRERIEVDTHSPTFIETVPGYGYTIKPEE
ncbi:MAG TPA: response regulator transcription factor [Anaerolineaceae bacterium]|nr:response regulator transcription factor [Anaerolineaceae bacterium]